MVVWAVVAVLAALLLVYIARFVHERSMRAEEARPGAELERGELFDERSLHVQIFPCPYKFIAFRFPKGTSP